MIDFDLNRSNERKAKLIPKFKEPERSVRGNSSDALKVLSARGPPSKYCDRKSQICWLKVLTIEVVFNAIFDSYVNDSVKEKINKLWLRVNP